MKHVPHPMVLEGTSSRKLFGVMPLLCKSQKGNGWVGTTLIIKVYDNVPIYLNLT